MKKFLIIFILIFSITPCFAKNPEKYYQTLWCNANNGKAEVILSDKTRVDCVTNDYAIEFDFAKKWAESIGQALYYGEKTGKQAGVVLIMSRNDKRYLNRLKTVAD